MMPDRDRILRQTERYYSAKLREHGATARGVDWNTEASQQLRFDQLLRLLQGCPAGFSLNDYGCGYGAFVDHLDRRGLTAEYCGFDLSERMIDAARQRLGDRPCCRFTSSREDLAPANYTVASGIFNVKLQTPDLEWGQYVLATIDELASLSTEGIAFNLLSLDSDPERRRADLYYADPSYFLDHCKQRYSRSVALLQDYGLYEFTMIVRKRGDSSWRSW